MNRSPRLPRPALLRLALGLLLGLALLPAGAATAPESIGACPSACIDERDHCLQKLGPPAEANCTVGMKLCIERCDPQRQNGSAFDAARERRENQQIRGASAEQGSGVRLCEQRCETSSTLCAREGATTTNECALGRQNCIDRCYGK